MQKRQEILRKRRCIETIELATKQNSNIADESIFALVTKTQTGNAPRVKWESAKVIANIAHLYPTKLNKAISNLLTNSKGNGTVVRVGLLHLH